MLDYGWVSQRLVGPCLRHEKKRILWWMVVLLAESFLVLWFPIPSKLTRWPVVWAWWQFCNSWSFFGWHLKPHPQWWVTSCCVWSTIQTFHGWLRPIALWPKHRHCQHLVQSQTTQCSHTANGLFENFRSANFRKGFFLHLFWKINVQWFASVPNS